MTTHMPPLTVFMLTTADPVQRMITVLDSLPVIRNWYNYLPGCYLIASWSASPVIAQQLRVAAPNCWFVITQTFTGATDGLFSNEVWDFINNPKDSGKHAVPNLAGSMAPATGLRRNFLTHPSASMEKLLEYYKNQNESSDDSDSGPFGRG